MKGLARKVTALALLAVQVIGIAIVAQPSGIGGGDSVGNFAHVLADGGVVNSKN